MGDAPDSRELAKRFDLLKKDFEIMQANVNSTLNEMRANVNSTLSGMRADMAAHREDAARRETRLILAIAGMIGLAVAVIGFLIRLPA
ncbi:MAG: hypothetical protein OXD36_00655 [Rhodobacter sp.]|nr:hypothetical protein [Rhodobacter sp.]MCY4240235.1 hypothetical protein [Rhodobacter sp.]